MYYKSPLLINSETLSVVKDLESVKESIDAFLELLVFTSPGGFKPDHEFGFEFWSNEFQNFIINNFNNRTSDTNLVSSKGDHTDKESCEKGLKKSIEIYEPRLKNVRVTLNVEQNNKIAKTNNFRTNDIKYDVFIRITGKMIIDHLASEDYIKDIQFSVGPMIIK